MHAIAHSTTTALRRKLVLFGHCALLAGCAVQAKPGLTIDYDKASFEPAVIATDPPRPMQIVETATPLPLPGQLKPLPGKGTSTEVAALPPLETAGAANESALFEPETDGYVNAIQVYPYVEGALYRLYTAPEQVSDIALQQGETLVSVSAGDTVRWVVGDTVSGAGAAERVHVLVKPIAEDLQTNLVITTDRRAYRIEMESTADTYMASVSWRYPAEALTALRRQNDAAIAAEATTVDRGLTLENLAFRYRITGDDVPWRPVRVFDDGRKVYIQFPGRLDQGEAPPLFVVDAKGENQLVNYRVKGTYYVVDRLFAAAELRLGEDPQQTIRIVRTDAREVGRNSKRVRNISAWTPSAGEDSGR
ncbi:P-type conjugative transfer protein TrbG [uncultured Erythrobacter sp.]|uniref:P-type conjugative transfer protein TrbG n=1 Tax=uncultured Erythrobacter sp. TaxID=263913 RepID=UPI00261DB5EF|nr:P-type conjugative transfer protein TrbG [uncultured Erythrobacter sp.]